MNYNTTTADPAERIDLFALICALAIPLMIGVISAFLTRDAMKIYHFLNKPALAPPGWVFPIVWAILYILMGIASYLIFRAQAPSKTKTPAYIVYSVQLIMNFVWSLLFFGASLYLLSSIWLGIMLLLVIICTVLFFRIDRRAGLLMIPYAAWSAFALYLNIAVYFLSITPMPLHK